MDEKGSKQVDVLDVQPAAAAHEQIAAAVLNETIDASVFERWRTDAKYRPPNLADWPRRKRADVAKLKTSFPANDPKQVVAD